MSWFNYYGLIAMLAIMIPNIVYAAKTKATVTVQYRNRTVETLEQIGRYGAFLFMIFNVPYTCFGFWFPHAFTVYLGVNGALILAYLLCWICLWRNDGLIKALALSILPSLIFLFSGVFLANIPLLISALLFAPAHILISCKNANISRPGDPRRLP